MGSAIKVCAAGVNHAVVIVIWVLVIKEAKVEGGGINPDTLEDGRLESFEELTAKHCEERKDHSGNGRHDQN